MFGFEGFFGSEVFEKQRLQQTFEGVQGLGFLDVAPKFHFHLSQPPGGYFIFSG